MSARSEWRTRQRKIAAAKGMTLKQLRETQPRRDQSQAAFQPSIVEGRVAYSPWPRTLDELQTRCGEFGAAALIECQWMCVERWLWGERDPELRNPLDETRTAVSLVRGYDRSLLCFPHHDGEPRPTPVYFRLSDAEQQEMLRLADTARLEWDLAGRPHLNPDRIKLIFQVVTSSPAWRANPSIDTLKQDTE